MLDRCHREPFIGWRNPKQYPLSPPAMMMKTNNVVMSLDGLLNGHSYCVLVLDPAGTVCNLICSDQPPSADRSEIVGRPISELLSDEFLDVLAEPIQLTLADTQTRQFEWRSASDAACHPLRGHVATCGAQQVLLTIHRVPLPEHPESSVADQVNKLSRLNEQLIHSEARTRSIIDGIAVGVAVASKDGRLEIFNRAARQIVGVGLVETGQDDWASVYGLYLPDGITPCPTERLPLVRAISGEYVKEAPLLVRHPSYDDPIQLSVTASPFYDDQGEVEGGVAIFQDVTEKSRAERLLAEAREELETRIKELQESEEKYQDLYENAPDMYVTADAFTARIVECNQTLATAIGYEKREIVGKSVIELHDSSCVEEVKAALQSFRESGVFPSAQFVLKCKDARTIDVSLNVSAIRDQRGRVVLGRCVWRDTTKWKRTEELLRRHREELAHLTRLHTAGEMATGLAHELNQPLNAIVNYASGFVRRTEVGSSVTPELHSAAHEIVREAERAASIIQGLRRLVAKQSPAQAETDLNEVFREAVLMCRGEARRQGVVVERHLAKDLPILTVDAVQVKQVAICLILNSIESLANSSKLDRRVALSTRLMPGNRIEVEVADNGSTSLRADPDQVFEPFYTTKEDGMGMGLAISRSIVENHGGRIWFRESPLGGIVFCFSLPINDGKST